MYQYVVLINNKSDYCDRYWVIRNTLEEARAVAKEYNSDGKYLTSVYQIRQEL
jgi:hypothetical protein